MKPERTAWAVWALAAAICAGASGAELRSVADEICSSAYFMLPTTFTWEVQAKLESEEGGVWGGRSPRPGGTNLTGSVRLHDAATGGNVLWAMTNHPATMNTDTGLATLTLPTALPGQPLLVDVLGLGRPIWLDVQLEGHPGAASPRHELTSSPYSLYAWSVSGSRGDFSVNGWLLGLQGGTSRLCEVRSGDLDAATLTVTGDIEMGGGVDVQGGVSAGSYEGVGAAPVGMIIWWYGAESEVPAGWHICDGTHGTPNLQSRFVLGAEGNPTPATGNTLWNGFLPPTFSSGEWPKTGGQETVSLLVEQMPKHAHAYSTHNSSDWRLAGGNKNLGIWNGTGSGGTSTAGHGAAHENMPPYRALYSIMRVE